MCVCVLCPRIDPLCFLAGCRRRRLNQGLIVALGFFLISVFCVIFRFLWVHAVFSSLPFVISTSVIAWEDLSPERPTMCRVGR